MDAAGCSRIGSVIVDMKCIAQAHSMTGLQEISSH